jgi:hypothetical protein
VLGEDFFGVHSKFFIRSGEVRPLLLSGSNTNNTIHRLYTIQLISIMYADF